MKEQILELRNSGKTYNEIQKELGCSKSTISYHCGEGQKEKFRKRTQKLRDSNALLSKCDQFNNKKLRYASNAFQNEAARRKTDDPRYIKDRTFDYKDVVNKFGKETVCYLTGEKINLFDDQYHFDHIVPVSKGGGSSIENLGITIPQANMAKQDLSVEELLLLCEKILKHNGYSVTKN